MGDVQPLSEPGRVVAILATLDTKEGEALFVRDRLARDGFDARLVDCSTRPEAGRRRDEIIAGMGARAAGILRAWHAEGTLAGAIGLGGNQGTAIAAMALRALPVGVPKVIVSTIASGNLRPHIDSSDIAVIFSVGDLLGGPNAVTRGVLAHAAGMLAGMIRAPHEDPQAAVTEPHATVWPGSAQRAVALTTLGNTEPAALRAMDHLRQRGYEVVPFHASGAGGSAMEALIAEGRFVGVLDLTTHELLGEIFGEDIYAPVARGRLTAAGAAGLPQIIAPGGLDYFVFGPEESIPMRYRGRAIHHHNPYNTNVRATADELRTAGEVLTARLNAARGPAAFLFPRRGWSQVGAEGGVLWDRQANEALRQTLRGALDPGRVRYIELDAGINDPAFADTAAEVLVEFARAPARPS